MAQLGTSLSDDRTLPLSGGPKVNDLALAAARQDKLVPTAAGRCDDRDTLALARQLNGSLTALMLYMGEIKQRSDEIARTPAERRHVQMVVDNALLQTERVCALVNQMSGARGQFAPTAHDQGGAPLARPGRACKSLTPRESEVLKLISEGHSNKEGALRMGISPRTFESHRAEAMRKLGARNTAELVRAALLNQIG
ncbi:putative transcriptional regulatory protein, LuxR family [Bradyrhizobium oligotrophicum S58]|uniref:Putative transcriptional regulatory protein, LuxR family n=1 Tax=Bradyrhizobium oligotrophicum S58 TaxID=1245469 RepID=M4Z1B6_9BRAD|nr:helix-turn-helix transcriptional regulator [Bradyrhizobium oligotrophicum]BAM86497.1 putative transcriptional regulatory protein, LuxR family [Bradyrhizobium oligotrophicum S58]